MAFLDTRKYSPELPEVFASIMAEYFIEENTPWTITGLCLHLKITKETFNEYSKILQFSESIKMAKLIVENYAENRLFNSPNVTGIIFNLKNNFGWVDKTEAKNTNDNTNRIVISGEVEEWAK